jgi:hypothetical protein
MSLFSTKDKLLKDCRSINLADLFLQYWRKVVFLDISIFVCSSTLENFCDFISKL